MAAEDIDARRPDDRLPGDVMLDEVMERASRRVAARPIVLEERRKLTKPPRSTERARPEGFDEDALETLLAPDADALVVFHDECRKVMFRRQTWIVRMRIIEGDHAGRLIAWWLRALPTDDRLRRIPRGSAICAAFVAATGLLPPRDLARRKPSYWLADAQFIVATRQVLTDVNKAKRSAAASYSVVAFVRERLVGSPPALQERGR